MHPFSYVGGVHNMLKKSNLRYLAVIVFGMIGCSNLVYACDPGFVEIQFTGKGVTNALQPTTDPYSAPASLGIVKLRSTTPGTHFKLECGVRGVVTAPLTYDDPYNPSTATTTFTSYIVCGDDDHTEAVVTSTATLSLGVCFPGTYSNPGPSPVGDINGPFDEPGTIQGTWGLLEGATGNFHVWGTSACGLQDWNVEATVCVGE